MSIDHATREYVLWRDGRCLLSVLDKVHQCRDGWGEPHDPADLGRLTIEHVRAEPGGMRRDDVGWLVAMCAEGNVAHSGSTTEMRALLNAWLAAMRRMEEIKP